MPATTTETTAPEPEEPKEYRVRIRATARVMNEETISARSFEEAVEKAKRLDLTEYRWGYRYQHDDGVEGDEIGFVSEVGEEDDDGCEIDLRAEGEPFSWTACDIVKDFAKLDVRLTADVNAQTVTMAMDDIRPLQDLMRRARAACTKE